MVPTSNIFSKLSSSTRKEVGDSTCAGMKKRRAGTKTCHGFTHVLDILIFSRAKKGNTITPLRFIPNPLG